MKKMTMLLLLLAVMATGCIKVYQINPDGSETEINQTEHTEKEPETTVEEPNDEKEQQTGNGIVEDETPVETEESQVDQLFVTQFENDEPYDVVLDLAELDSRMIGWSFRRNTDHTPVIGYNEGVDLELFDAYYINQDAADEKVVYLTFDEGYENGFTPEILDVLKENDVKASFFITGQFMRTDPDLVQRMVDEGHIVANHTVNHPNMPEINEEELYSEITGLADSFYELTGRELDPFLRPPAGKFSERTLYLTRKLGYRTIFWSMAHVDWKLDDQPGKEAAYEHVMTNYHNGAIILLHAVSESNTEAMDDIVKGLKAEGYRFGSLYELD